ncbi:uncharacterized protein LOC129908608 [Episyrphus balteatus]|uniref:uncharacterized protein LOC129908608 n=1 Tax=Episyrphus balteatus TaxID=286459 RepID=UPI002486C818|nr:uncharacterized protein LOC129908608 [Episyrphus balteatus]
MNIAKILFLVSFLLSFSQMVKHCDAKVVPLAPYDTPLEDVIHSCRKNCISQILGDFKWSGQLMTYFQCRGKPDCFMCWDYCRAVNVARVDLAKSMCNDSQYCSKGCNIACSFYQINTIYDVMENMT